MGTCTYGTCTADSVGATCCSGQGSPERAADSVGEPTDTDTLAQLLLSPCVDTRVDRRTLPATPRRHRRRCQPNLPHLLMEMTASLVFPRGFRARPSILRNRSFYIQSWITFFQSLSYLNRKLEPRMAM